MSDRQVRVGTPIHVSLFGFLKCLIRHPLGVYLHIDGYFENGELVAVTPVFGGKHRPPSADKGIADFLRGGREIGK